MTLPRNSELSCELVIEYILRTCADRITVLLKWTLCIHAGKMKGYSAHLALSAKRESQIAADG